MERAHVPAWKRLGLKLKYAKEDPSGSPTTPNTASGSRKTKFDEFDDQPLPSTTADGSTPLTQKEGPPTKKQKRVSFSSDTKLLDGDTARSALPSEVTDALAAAKQSQSKQPKKPKPSAAPSKHKSQDALDYLQQYYYNNETWKFQKNRETWILKHYLDQDTIPLDCNLPLAQYIHGLKSEGARQRLEAEATEKLRTQPFPSKPTSSSSSSPVSSELQLRESELKSALRSFPSLTLAEGTPTALWINSESIKRYELLLLALDPTKYRLARMRAHGLSDERNEPLSDANDDTLPSKTPVPEVSGASPVEEENHRSSPALKRQKKKKNRTAVVEYSSSDSSESSSESEAESQGGSAEDDETSSSGSEPDVTSDAESSSSSGSDTEQGNGT